MSSQFFFSSEQTKGDGERTECVQSIIIFFPWLFFGFYCLLSPSMYSLFHPPGSIVPKAWMNEWMKGRDSFTNPLSFMIPLPPQTWGRRFLIIRTSGRVKECMCNYVVCHFSTETHQHGGRNCQDICGGAAGKRELTTQGPPRRHAGHRAGVAAWSRKTCTHDTIFNFMGMKEMCGAGQQMDSTHSFLLKTRRNKTQHWTIDMPVFLCLLQFRFSQFWPPFLHGH